MPADGAQRGPASPLVPRLRLKRCVTDDAVPASLRYWNDDDDDNKNDTFYNNNDNNDNYNNIISGRMMIM
jgi:hypothetical protein